MKMNRILSTVSKTALLMGLSCQSVLAMESSGADPFRRNLLPPEIQSHIVSQSGGNSLKNMSLVCKEWQRIADQLTDIVKINNSIPMTIILNQLEGAVK